MKFDVAGIGAIGPGFASLAEFDALSHVDLMAPTSQPKPTIIPPRERRRAPLIVKLAVEAASQACSMAKADPVDLPVVFASAMGDTQITDYMCRATAEETIVLSPTRFHNSVHNAAAGYWSISTGCTRAANSIASGRETTAVALLEALLQSDDLNNPVLLACFDVQAPAALDFCGVGPSYGMAFVAHVHPAGAFQARTQTASSAVPETGVLEARPFLDCVELLRVFRGEQESAELALASSTTMAVGCSS